MYFNVKKKKKLLNSAYLYSVLTKICTILQKKTKNKKTRMKPFQFVLTTYVVGVFCDIGQYKYYTVEKKNNAPICDVSLISSAAAWAFPSIMPI